MPKPVEKIRRQNDSGAVASTSENQILIHFKSGATEPLFSPEDSARQGSWTGLYVEEHHSPPIAFPQGFPRRHIVAVHYRRATSGRLPGQLPRCTPVRHGSLDIIPQGTALGVYGEHDTEFIILALEPGFVHKIADESGITDATLVRHLGIRDPQIEYIALALKSELDAGCPSGRIYGDGLAVALAARLLERYSAQVTSRNCNALMSGYTLRRVTNYIEDNLTKDLTLAQIAAVAHMSPHYFSRAFRKSTGIPPHRYVIDRRIEKAKTLLSDNYLPLVEVGLSVGFQNQSHFTTLFHKRTGVTPKVYRSRINNTFRLLYYQ